jgi:hypothetical protein
VSRYARDQHDLFGHGLDDLLGRPADFVQAAAEPAPPRC